MYTILDLFDAVKILCVQEKIKGITLRKIKHFIFVKSIKYIRIML